MKELIEVEMSDIMVLSIFGVCFMRFLESQLTHCSSWWCLFLLFCELRVNSVLKLCIVLPGPLSDVPENIDYDFAQQELMLQQMVDDPIQVAIRSIEKQHEEDKQG